MTNRRRRSLHGALALLIAASSACRPEGHPTPREPVAGTPAASVAPVTVAIPTIAPHVDSVTAPVGSFTLVDTVDSMFVRRLPTELSNRLYQHWAPDTAAERACSSIDEDGYELQAAWGIARIRLLTLDEAGRSGKAKIRASEPRQVGAKLEVVRVVSVEGDPQTSDGMNYTGEMMIVQPVIDTIEVQWHRRDGSWHSCWPTWLAHDPASPISIVGPDYRIRADSSKARRRVPDNATWERARVIADSVGRSGPDVSIDHPKKGVSP